MVCALDPSNNKVVELVVASAVAEPDKVNDELMVVVLAAKVLVPALPRIIS